MAKTVKTRDRKGRSTAKTPRKKAATPRELTAKERAFVREYCVDHNATQAALRAGYSQRSAGQVGHETLKKHEVALAIAEEERRLAKAAEVDAVELRRELLVLARSNVEHYMVCPRTGRLILAPGAPPEAMRAVSSVKYKTRTIPQKDGDPIVEYHVEFKLWSKPDTLIKLSQKAGVLLAGSAEPDVPPGDAAAVKPALRVIVHQDQRTRDRLARRAGAASPLGAPRPRR